MEDYNKYFDFELNKQQQKGFNALCDFVKDHANKIFVLRGYAGTGKTTLIGGFIKKLRAEFEEKNNTPESTIQTLSGEKENSPFAVLASTGRAAKILSDKTDENARTIHSLVYKFIGLSEDADKAKEQKNKSVSVDPYGQIYIDFNAVQINSNRTIVYIVDEASMVSDKKHSASTTARFGEGNLLDDLLNFDKNGQFIFIGDPCQLPPIYQKESPALDAEYLRKKYGIPMIEYTLTEILRQEGNNDILNASFELRKLWQKSLKETPFHGLDGGIIIETPGFTPLPLKGYSHIHVHQSEIGLFNKYIETVKIKGYDYTTLICNSNKECNELSRYIREALHGKKESIIVGDLLLVTQNNFVVDLVNGDLVVVEEIGEIKIRANLHFVDVQVKEISSQRSYRLLLLMDLLMNQQANIDSVQHWRLMMDFMDRIMQRGIKFKKEAYEKFKKNHCCPVNK
jgi:ATP-dependent exoDNAse (exonuclease V) alpha subunit